ILPHNNKFHIIEISKNSLYLNFPDSTSLKYYAKQCVLYQKTECLNSILTLFTSINNKISKFNNPFHHYFSYLKNNDNSIKEKCALRSKFYPNKYNIIDKNGNIIYPEYRFKSKIINMSFLTEIKKVINPII